MLNYIIGPAIISWVAKRYIVGLIYSIYIQITHVLTVYELFVIKRNPLYVYIVRDILYGISKTNTNEFLLDVNRIRDT